MKRKYLTLVSMMVFAVASFSGCNKENATLSPNMAPTSTVAPIATNAPTATVSPTTPTVEPTPVPTETVAQPTTPTPMSVPFAMVSPVPQSEVVDIVGTMTIDTYPVVDGSTATLPLSEAVFMAATGENAEVAAREVVHTKTTNSYNRLYDGEVDLLIVYEPAESIVERMKTEPLCIKPIGLDALVFLANTANPLESLTMEQLVDIYSGKINNWSEVGGLDKKLLAFQRPAGSGSQTLMQKLVMGDAEMVSGDNVFRYSTMSDILEGMLSYNNEDNTLGYSVFYYANNMYFEKDLKLMGVDGVLPSTQTIYDGSYKLTNAFYAVVRTDEPADSNARKLFDWLTGEAGQQLVLDLGYVPVQMPEGADISDAKVVQQEKVEVLATEPLKEGQYFIFMNSQNMVSEYYYGDMTVYNHNWEEVANFYNVSLNHASHGIYTNRYLPIGQIRQSAEGEQIELHGIYDLEKGEYSIAPSYKAMSVLDMERGYFAVPPEDDDWQNWSIINGAGEVVLPKVSMEDWLTIWKFGNGYQEMSYDYENWENGCTFRYYDENLKLTHVYCESAAAIPDDEDKVEGVEYILIDAGGCLIDEEANVVMNSGTFLERYGDGENFDCEFQLYGPTLVEDGKIYAVKYCNQIFIMDSDLNPICPVFDERVVSEFQSASFFENFCYFFDSEKQEWCYLTYDGEPVKDSYGMIPDEIITNWTTEAYLMVREYGNQLFLEEYTADGDLVKYTLTLDREEQEYSLYYTEDGYLVFNRASGEMMQNPYYAEEMLVPQYIVSVLYQGSLIEVKHGIEGANIYALDENHQIWSVQNGNRLMAPSESIFEEFEYGYPLSNIVILEGQRIVYEIENAYLVFQGNGAASFLSGNYLYVVGYDGTEYIKAMHAFLNND
ncbi:MAG: substrate-binding domain-containing protein [Lachnospiraceae bacterium]|nr:substrate-binding domain-containing protein [Lachnospiraceae bacterium]